MEKTLIDIKKVQDEIRSLLAPIKPADTMTKADQDFLFKAKRSYCSKTLPEYYLIYFLFSELLKYNNLGPSEKISWSFPIDYNGKAFLIEYRKFGVGIFIHEETDEADAKKIAYLINRVVKKLTPFFNHIAEKAVKDSKINVINNNRDLFERYEYLNKLYKGQFKKYEEHYQKFKIKKEKSKIGTYTEFIPLDFKFKQQANWLAISCIEAFFSWTEHLFIHLAIIANGICDGEEIADLIGAEWKVKFIKAIPLKDKSTRKFYNELLLIRQQLRNFVAHGAFGKDGNAFSFHSGTGAVPVLIKQDKNKNQFALTGTLKFNEDNVIKLIEAFIDSLWKSPLKQAMNYTQKYGMPTILPYAREGIYSQAMKSADKMDALMEKLSYQMDAAANMDW